MTNIWDTEADIVNNGDGLRDITPILGKTSVDENGFTHYVFSKQLFNNPWYSISDDEFKLFKDFLEGGSRSYPSDGSIPCDIVAGEARKILNKITEYSNNPSDIYYDIAKKALEHGKRALVRGTLKLYLNKYTTRDWRRKRFTDDIDFWTFQVNVLERSLKECGFIKNKNTGEFEKQIQWNNPDKDSIRRETLFAANNLNQLLDFGAGSYLEGSGLKEIFDKKIKRGHDVDISDIINVAMINDGKEGIHKDEWLNVWSAFEEAANRRSTRATSNMISICRYSLAIADHLEKVGKALNKYNDLIFDKEIYNDEDLKRICRTSVHWEDFLKQKGSDETREMLYDFYHEQAELKPIHAKNLRDFIKKVLALINLKYEYLKVIFEIV